MEKLKEGTLVINKNGKEGIIKIEDGKPVVVVKGFYQSHPSDVWVKKEE